MLLLMGDSGFNVRSELFSAGEQGLWLDPSDFSTMWQDSGQLTPVTAVGQPVGYIADKSGRGNHCVQATSGSRPTLQMTAGGQYYLLFDGVDDSLATASTVDFTATDEMTVIAGVRKLVDNVAYTVIVELSTLTGGVNTGTFVLAPNVGTYEHFSYGNVLASASASGFTAPVTNVVSALADISGDSIIVRANGVQAAQSTANQGTGNYGNYTLFIGRRGSSTLPFNGHLNQLIVRGRTTSGTTLTRAERFVGTKTGVTF